MITDRKIEYVVVMVMVMVMVHMSCKGGGEVLLKCTLGNHHPVMRAFLWNRQDPMLFCFEETGVWGAYPDVQSLVLHVILHFM